MEFIILFSCYLGGSDLPMHVRSNPCKTDPMENVGKCLWHSGLMNTRNVTWSRCYSVTESGEVKQIEAPAVVRVPGDKG